MPRLNIVRDLLDKQLLDRNECELGRVDGVVIEVPDDGRPRLVRLEVGGSVLAARIGRWAIGPTRAIARRFGPKRLAPVKFEWSSVTKLGRDVHLDVDAEHSPALAWEKWVDKVLIKRLPGAKA
ncbi:MAG: hypothetical protein ABR582_10240 [Gemmatimonadaceae bacterium]